MARLGAFVLFVLAAVAASGANASARTARLSGDAVPVRYDLFFSPHIGVHTVDSTETVIVRTKRPLAYLTLNASRLHISSVTIDGSAATAVLHKSIEQVDFAIRGRQLPTGMHAIHVVFQSRIATAVDSAVGDYLGFSNAGTADEPFLVTQFEPSTARRMFPCFDEPAFRARFRVTVTAPAGLTVISNMPMTKRIVTGTNATSSFAQTPPMPAYLLTVDIAKMASISADANGIPVRVLTTPALIGSAKTALGDAVASLQYYEKFLWRALSDAETRLDRRAVRGRHGARTVGIDHVLFAADFSRRRTLKSIRSVGFCRARDRASMGRRFGYDALVARYRGCGGACRICGGASRRRTAPRTRTVGIHGSRNSRNYQPSGHDEPRRHARHQDRSGC